MADRALYLQNVIAVIWDFDKTLTPRYMQEPLFAKYGVDGATFWVEVNALAAHHQALGTKRVSNDTIYLEHILAYVRDGVFGDLTNNVLRQLGGEIGLLPGLPGYLDELRAFVRSRTEWTEHNIELEHYVVSTGLREMILGSAIGPVVEDVWACEFVEDSPGRGYLDAPHQTTLDDRRIKRVGYAIDNTTKTRAVFEIQQGMQSHGHRRELVHAA